MADTRSATTVMLVMTDPQRSAACGLPSSVVHVIPMFLRFFQSWGMSAHMAVREEATMDDAAVQEISIEFPEASEYLLKLAIGPGSLTMRKGSGGPWVKGTYRDPSRSIPCKFRVDGGTAEIAQDRKIPKSFKL